MNNIDEILELSVIEYEAAVKGMQLRVVDSYELMAKSAMANRYAHHAKQAKERKIFDKEKALRSLKLENNEMKLNPSFVHSASHALQNYEVKFNADG